MQTAAISAGAGYAYAPSAMGSTNSGSASSAAAGTSQAAAGGDSVQLSASAGFSVSANQDLGKMLAAMLMLNVLFPNDEEKKDDSSNLLKLMALSMAVGSDQLSQLYSTSNLGYDAAGSATSAAGASVGTQLNVTA